MHIFSKNLKIYGIYFNEEVSMVNACIQHYYLNMITINIFIYFFMFCSVFDALAQSVSLPSNRGDFLNGRISPGGHFSATDSEGNFVNGYVSPGGYLNASDMDGNFINGHISPGGHFSGSDSNGNFINGTIQNHNLKMMPNKSRVHYGVSDGVKPRDELEVDFTGHDKLNKVQRAIEVIDRLDSIDRRDKQMDIETKRYNFAKERLELEIQNHQRLVEKQNLEFWKKEKANEAASYATAAMSSIDMNSPDGERKLNDWILYARANGVSEDTIQFMFCNKIRERDLIIELRENNLIKELGADGIKVYDAFLKTGINPDKARYLALQSKKAEEILTYLQNLAMLYGIAFDIPVEEMENIKKMIGDEDRFINPITGKYFDASTYYYDLDAVNDAINKFATPQLKDLYAKKPIIVK